MGTLHYGDNLDILSRYIADASVDVSPQLVQLREELKPTGSLYLHCDSTACVP